MQRKALSLTVAALVVVLRASAAQASSFSVNFCPGDASCPANITEARLTFDEVLGGSDPNDYLVTIQISGGAGSPQFIDSVQFSIAGIQTPGEYETKPTLQFAPVQGSAWTVFYDQISGSPTDCSSDTFTGQGVCAQSTGNGASTNATNTWTFFVDLADDQAPVGVGSHVDLRAHFLKIGTNGAIQNGGLLSPESGGVLQTTGNSETTTGRVPEPAMLSLFGVALTVAANRLRRVR